MSSRLYLHIGTHKTATTSLQHFFSKNRKALRHAGIYYPSQNIIDAPNHYAHHRIAHAIAGKEERVDFERAKRFFELAGQRLTDKESLFVSAEPFYRHVISNEDNKKQSKDDDYRAYIARVREATADFDVRIVVMLRRQDLFVESLYSEHVLSTSYKKKITDFIAEKGELLDYAARLALWAEEFGAENIMLQSFERESFDTPIERFFVEWLGGTWSDSFEDVGAFNTSLGRTFVEFKRRINFKSQPRAMNTQFRTWITQVSKMPSLKDIKKRNSYYISPKSRYDLMAQFEQGNSEIAQRYLSRDQLFMRPIEVDTEKFELNEDLTENEFQLITKNILRLVAAEKRNAD